MHRGSSLRAKSLASVAMVALMFGVASIASAQHSSGIMGSVRDGPVKDDGKAGYDQPNQCIHLTPVAVADNMEPVVPHPDQDGEARQKLAALEQRTGKRPNILILLLDDISWTPPSTAFSGEVEVAGWRAGGGGRRLRLVSVVRWPALRGERLDRQASAGWRSSQSRRRMLWTRLARPILVVARARPMVRTNRPILAFCSAKTCSIVGADRRLLRVGPGGALRHRPAAPASCGGCGSPASAGAAAPRSSCER